MNIIDEIKSKHTYDILGVPRTSYNEFYNELVEHIHDLIVVQGVDDIDVVKQKLGLTYDETV